MAAAAFPVSKQSMEANTHGLRVATDGNFRNSQNGTLSRRSDGILWDRFKSVVSLLQKHQTNIEIDSIHKLLLYLYFCAEQVEFTFKK